MQRFGPVQYTSSSPSCGGARPTTRMSGFWRRPGRSIMPTCALPECIFLPRDATRCRCQDLVVGIACLCIGLRIEGEDDECAFCDSRLTPLGRFGNAHAGERRTMIARSLPQYKSFNSKPDKRPHERLGPWSKLQGHRDTVSNASTATARSRRGLLRWRDIEEGMVGRANHSIKHAVVPALMSVMPTVEPDSLLQRHYNELSKNKGKYRPFIVVEKPHGPNRPGRIVLTTHFDRRPISEVDAGAQALAVALGTRTPPWPAEDSPRIRTEPEWLEENSYAIAYAIALQYDRQATRFRAAGKEYQVVGGELKTLRKVCAERAVSLANMSREQLEALKASYERIAATLPSAASSWRGSFYSVQSHVSVLPPIAENTLPETQETINEIDQEGFTQVKRVRRRARRGKNREESEGPAV